MGTWAAPWEDEETVARFEARMAEPWIAVVTSETIPDYGPPRVGDVRKKGPDGKFRMCRRSGLFRRLKPIPQIGTEERWSFEAPELYDLLGDDALFDELGDAAEEKKADFDVREHVRKQLRWIYEEHGLELVGDEGVELHNRLRALVGLPPF